MKKGKDTYSRDARIFIDGCQGLGAARTGVYNVIIDFIYLRDGKTLRDDRHLAGLMGESLRLIRSLTDQLIELGKLDFDGEYLTNKKASEQIQREKQFKISAKKFGRKGAEKRVRLNKNNDLQNDTLKGPLARARAREIDINQINKLTDTPPGPRSTNSTVNVRTPLNG